MRRARGRHHRGVRLRLALQRRVGAADLLPRHLGDEVQVGSPHPALRLPHHHRHHDRVLRARPPRVHRGRQGPVLQRGPQGRLHERQGEGRGADWRDEVHRRFTRRRRGGAGRGGRSAARARAPYERRRGARSDQAGRAGWGQELERDLLPPRLQVGRQVAVPAHLQLPRHDHPRGLHLLQRHLDPQLQLRVGHVALRHLLLPRIRRHHRARHQARVHALRVDPVPPREQRLDLRRRGRGHPGGPRHRAVSESPVRQTRRSRFMFITQ